MTIGLRKLMLDQPRTIEITNDDEKSIASLIGTTDPKVKLMKAEEKLPFAERTLNHTTEIDPHQVYYRHAPDAITTLSQIMTADDATVIDNDDAKLDFIKKTHPDVFEHVVLSYANYRESLDDNTKLIEHIVQGENIYETPEGENLWFSVGGNETDTARDMARNVIDDVTSELDSINIDFDASGNLEDLIIDELNNLNESTTETDIVKNTSPFFVQALLELDDEMGTTNMNTNNVNDSAGIVKIVTERMETVGILVTPKNVQLIANAYEDYYYDGAWIDLTLFGRVQIDELFDNPDTETVTLKGAHIWVGNPEDGSGCLTDSPIEGEITVPRANLHHDSHSPYVSVDDVCGFVPSYFEPMKVTLNDTLASNAA